MDQTLAKNQSKKRWTMLLFIVVNLAVIGGIVYSEFGRSNGASKLSELTVKPLYLAACAACFLIVFASEILKYGQMLHALTGRRDPRGALECAILGKYYDNITPMGSGGQPFQILFLSRRGYSAGVSGSVPVVGFLTMQLSFILPAFVLFLFTPGTAVPAMLRVSGRIGLCTYSFVPLCIILFAVAPSLLERAAGAVTRLLSRLRLIRDGGKVAEKTTETLRSYSESLRALCARPALFLGQLFFSFVYRAAIVSIPWLVLRCFGVQNSYWQTCCQVMYICAASSLIPTPGNAGAAEGSFYAVFSSIAQGSLFWAVLLWRFLTYYIWLILGLLCYGARTMVRQEEREQSLPKGRPSAAQFVDVFYPAIDDVVQTVCSYASRIDNCCVICPESDRYCCDSFDFDVIRVPVLRLPGLSLRLSLPGLSRRLRRYLKEHRFDVFHAHSPFAVGRYALRMGKRLGVPVVATFHSEYYDDILSTAHTKLAARILTKRIVRFYQAADEVWACSRGTARTLRSYGYHGRIHLMDSGVDLEPTDDPDGLRSRAASVFSLPTDRHILLFVAQHAWHKNLRMVLETCALLRRRGFRFCMLIAGTGLNQRAAASCAKRLGLGDSVRFIGPIPEQRLLKGLFLASDLFFFPSVCDSAPLVVREAAAAGLPSLLVRNTNAAECVMDGVNGFTEENDAGKMANKITYIFSGIPMKEIRRRAHDSIPVSWDTVLVEVEEQYLALLSSKINA